MDARELELDYSEVYRYLGYRKGIPEGEVKEVVERCVGELVAQAELRSVARRFPLEFLGEQRFRIGFAMDRLAARASAIGRMSRAVIYQAAGAMLIESYCDALNRKLKEEAAAEGKFLRPRFSPGYGDLPLAIQPELFRVLEVQKNTGITLTESLLMMPTKSVTALIGVSTEDSHCLIQGCESCGKRDCSFRR